MESVKGLKKNLGEKDVSRDILISLLPTDSRARVVFSPQTSQTCLVNLKWYCLVFKKPTNGES